MDKVCVMLPSLDGKTDGGQVVLGFISNRAFHEH